MTSAYNIERHPLEPFLPDGARLLLLGSFPPPQQRWCMPFYYPNPQNDMWRIMGLVFYGDAQRFVITDSGKRVFDCEKIMAFCASHGIAIYDTATVVRRLRGNASDEFLEIVEPTDIAALLRQIPACQDVCCTGGKAAQTLAKTIGCELPKPGHSISTEYDGKTIRFWRMPSSSRAYPMSLVKKAEYYGEMMKKAGLI